MARVSRPSASWWLVPLALASGCGYRLAQTGRTIHVALSAEGPTHPDLLPSVQGALAERLRAEGFALGADPGADELDVVVVAGGERAAIPTGSAAAGFEPAAWNAAVTAVATLRRADGTTVDLGEFESVATETAGPTAPLDDAAQRSAFAAAARFLAERLVGALVAAP